MAKHPLFLRTLILTVTGITFWGITLCGANTALAGKRVALTSVTGSGTSEHQLETLKSLLESAIMEHPKAKLVEVDPDMEIEAILNRLGYSYIFIVKAHLKNGKQRSKRVKIRTFDEIDVAVQRVAAAIIEGKDVSETVERGVVLEEERRGPKLMKAINSYGVYFGGTFPITNSFNTRNPMYALGGSYIFDLDRFLLEIRGDLSLGYNDVKTNSSTFTLGGDYLFLSRRVYALYGGLEIGFGHIADNLFANKSGFAAAVNVGTILLRYATVNVDVRVRTLILATKFNGSIPITTTLMVGLLF